MSGEIYRGAASTENRYNNNNNNNKHDKQRCDQPPVAI